MVGFWGTLFSDTVRIKVLWDQHTPLRPAAPSHWQKKKSEIPVLTESNRIPRFGCFQEMLPLYDWR